MHEGGSEHFKPSDPRRICPNEPRRISPMSARPTSVGNAHWVDDWRRPTMSTPSRCFPPPSCSVHGDPARVHHEQRHAVVFGGDEVQTLYEVANVHGRRKPACRGQDFHRSHRAVRHPRVSCVCGICAGEPTGKSNVRHSAKNSHFRKVLSRLFDLNELRRLPRRLSICDRGPAQFLFGVVATLMHCTVWTSVRRLTGGVVWDSKRTRLSPGASTKASDRRAPNRFRLQVPTEVIGGGGDAADDGSTTTLLPRLNGWFFDVNSCNVEQDATDEPNTFGLHVVQVKSGQKGKYLTLG
jgi:hypothetical protein